MNRRVGTRGSALVGSLVFIAVCLLAANMMAIRTLNGQRVADRMRDQLRAKDLAQAALEQLRWDLGTFLINDVYVCPPENAAFCTPGNAVGTFEWLDSLIATPKPPQFSLDPKPSEGIQNALAGLQSGMFANPRCLTKLPGIPTGAACVPANQPVQAPRAWIVSVENTEGGPLGHRDVLIEAQANVNGTIKSVRGTYRVALEMADIFRYAYFVNNFGWFSPGPGTSVEVYGEARSNGDFRIHSSPSHNWLDETTWVNGDLYASTNPNLLNPDTHLPANGDILGDPTAGWGDAAEDDYLTNWTWEAADRDPAGQLFWISRPPRRLTFPDQPAIGGAQKILPYGFGFDTDYPTMADPDQRRFEHQPTQPIPYLGDFLAANSPYRKLGEAFSSTLHYNADTNNDGNYGESGDAVPPPIAVVYKGPDGVAGVNGATGINDDNDPLVLVGTSSHPIELQGLVIVPGDVVISGYVTGRGTIYAGRNVHIAGEIRYMKPPTWPPLERNSLTNRLRQKDATTGPRSNLGSVDVNGNYTPPAPGDCP